ncbi:MAG TPA: hypothetical protein VHW03_09000 [Chthoniobacterales bacterium]|jgi:hypothetical protein|nr:hypothetical protein [Chthoniobacterales bacterium]
MDAELTQRLAPMARVIAQQLTRKPEHFITHPSEMKFFHALRDDDLREFAHRHGWRVVRRVGGRRIEFYNDAHERQERARTGNFRPEEPPAE